MTFKIAIMRHVGTENEAIEKIMPEEYDNEKTAYDACIAIETSEGFEYGRLAAAQIEKDKLREMIGVEYEQLAENLERGGFAFYSEGECSAHEYIYAKICEIGNGQYSYDAAIQAITQIKKEFEIEK